MRASSVLRMLALAAAAVAATTSTTMATDPAIARLQGRQLTFLDLDAALARERELEQQHTQHASRVLHKKHKDASPAPTPAAAEAEEEEEEEEETTPAPTTKKHKKKEATPAPAPEPTTTAPAPTTTAPPPAPTTTAPAPTTAAPAATTAAPAATTTAPAPATSEAPKKKHSKKEKKEDESAAAEETPAPTPSSKKKVNDGRIKGNKKDGVIDGSSEGSAEIDKIDLRNKDNWKSVYNDPPLLVIKASLYAFISYNDSKVCDSFNMTLDVVEQKPNGNGTFDYHVVTLINCTKDGVDETKGRFILNFAPEGKRLLLTECGHREEGEILNWLKISHETPECMTPTERKEFLHQPMKHVHASNGTSTDTTPKMTDFFARLEELDGKEVAIAGSATVALIAIIVVIVVAIMRKRKAQKDLERTIAGAKADHADDEDDKDKEDDDKDLVDKKKKKSEEDEGSFVNSPAVKV